MINELLTKAGEKLTAVKNAKYINVDRGQLDTQDLLSQTKYPCILYDISHIEYTDKAQKAQQGIGSLKIRIADYCSWTSSIIPPKDDMTIFDIIKDVYTSVQGLTTESTTPLTRASITRRRRDDRIREYVMYFKFSLTDNDLVKTNRTVSGEPKFEII